jgi:hypothetical protein
MSTKTAGASSFFERTGDPELDRKMDRISVMMERILATIAGEVDKVEPSDIVVGLLTLAAVIIAGAIRAGALERKYIATAPKQFRRKIEDTLQLLEKGSDNVH